MSKEKLLELVKLLSALESWTYVDKHNLPNHLSDRLDVAIDELTKEILK